MVGGWVGGWVAYRNSGRIRVRSRPPRYPLKGVGLGPGLEKEQEQARGRGLVCRRRRRRRLVVARSIVCSTVLGEWVGVDVGG